MTTTSFLQKYPNYYSSFEECENFNKNYNKEQSNNRYKNFTQIHFTAGDEDQFNMYRFDRSVKKDKITEDIDLSQNIFKKFNLFQPWSKFKNLDPLSTINTFRYIFYKFKKGIFIKILNNELKVFLPFSNVNFINEWYKNIKIDPKYENMYSFFENICNMEGRSFNKNHINNYIESWYGNNCLVRYEFPINEGDTNVSSIHDMLIELCKNRKVPDIEFFINRRDFPIITREGFEAYYDLWNEMNKPLVSHNYEKYTPILSMSSFEHFADILIPSYDDWNRSQSPNKWFPKSSQIYNYKFDIPWKEKISTAVFRGSSTGSGLTIETNQRLKVSYMSKIEKMKKNHKNYLDAGITKWNLRPKKFMNNEYLQTLNLQELDLELVDKLTPYEQSRYKYIIHIDGHVTAHRLSYQLSMNSVILLVKNKWKNWYYDLLNPYEHYIPVQEDLSDLFEKIEWCRNNDHKCQIIAENAKKFYDYYLTQNGILDHWQKILVDLKSEIGNFDYNHIKPIEIQLINQYKFLFPSKKNEEIKNTMKNIFDNEYNIQKLLFLKDNYNIIENEIVKKYINKINDINLNMKRNFPNLKTIQNILHTLIKNKKFSKIIKFEKTIFKNKSSHIELYSLNNYKFIIKSTDNSQKMKEYIHESFVSIMAVNNFLKEIPNFCYNFGYFQEDDKYKIIYEYIEGQTLQEYIKSSEFNLYDFINIILQICLSINFAQDNCCFVHYDLSIWNIIIKKLDHEVNIDYTFNNKIIRFKTKMLPIIIDYGRSHIIHDNMHYGMINMYTYSKIFDILYLLLTSIYEIIITTNLSKTDFNILLRLVNFISNTKYCPNNFKTSKDIKKFFYKAKKYSNIIYNNKYELENKTPIDLFYHIVNNIKYKYNFSYQDDYKPCMNMGYSNHTLEKIFSYNDNILLLTYETQIKYLLKQNFESMDIHELYLENNKLNNFMEEFILFLNEINLNFQKYKKNFSIIQTNIKNILEKKINLIFKEYKKMNINFDILKNYNEDIFLFPQRLDKYVKENESNMDHMLYLLQMINNMKKIAIYKENYNFQNYKQTNNIMIQIANLKTIQTFKRIIL